MDSKSPQEFLRSDARRVFNFSLKFRNLLTKLDMLWLLFDEIDLTIRFGRVEIGWLSFSQVQKISGWLPRFCVPKCRLCAKLTRFSGPLICKLTLLFDLFHCIDHNGGLRLYRFYSENCLDLCADFAF